MVALGVGLGRRGFAEQPAQVNEVLLRRGTFLQLRGVPLRDKLVCVHRRILRVPEGLCRAPNFIAALRHVDNSLARGGEPVRPATARVLAGSAAKDGPVNSGA